MEKNKKELKLLSIAILVLAALVVVKSILNVCINGIKVEPVEGLSAEVVQVIAIIAFVLSFVVLLPQIYVGIKGIQIANGAKSGKAHIVWAVILAVFAVIALISSFGGLAKFSFNAVLNVITPAIDVLLYVCYIIYARKVANE
jgi:hypothetical protein